MYSSHSKKDTFQEEQIHKKSTFQKDHIPKIAHFKKGTFHFENIPKIAHFKKGTFQKEKEFDNLKNYIHSKILDIPGALTTQATPSACTDRNFVVEFDA